MIWVELKELASDRLSIRRRVDIGGPPSEMLKHDFGRLPGVAQQTRYSSFACRSSASGGERKSDGEQWSSTETVLLALCCRLKDRWRSKHVNSFTRDGRVAPSFSHLSAFGLRVLS